MVSYLLLDYKFLLHTKHEITELCKLPVFFINGAHMCSKQTNEPITSATENIKDNFMAYPQEFYLKHKYRTDSRKMSMYDQKAPIQLD